MLSTAESGEKVNTSLLPRVMVLGADPGASAEVASPLEAQSFRVTRFGTTAEAITALRRERPAVLIMVDAPGVDASAFCGVGKVARELGIPVLDVIEPGLGMDEAWDRHGDADDWVCRSAVAVELPLRVGRLLRRRQRSEAPRPSSGLPNDSRLFPLIVHDLRTPLNVIGLSLRMIDQAIPKGDADLEEDLRFVEENFKQIEKMLAQLSDYCRLFEAEMPGPPSEFSPARLLAEVVESCRGKVTAKNIPVRVDVDESCPSEASLDPVRARQAIQYAIWNATASANGAGVHITLRGGPDRLVTEVGIDQPPPSSVKSVELRPHLFERLCGTAAERRGMDLAIAARISELFGGGARLEADQQRGTKIILDWPSRIAAS